jgi:hypothetical protein
LIYGRYQDKTIKDVQESDQYPYLEHNGRTYRITDLHQTALGVNYQAEECDPREAAVVGVATIGVPIEESAPVPPPDYLTWAKAHGWKGIGRIPFAVKEAYEEEFDVRQE